MPSVSVDVGVPPDTAAILARYSPDRPITTTAFPAAAVRSTVFESRRRCRLPVPPNARIPDGFGSAMRLETAGPRRPVP